MKLFTSLMLSLMVSVSAMAGGPIKNHKQAVVTKNPLITQKTTVEHQQSAKDVLARANAVNTREFGFAPVNTMHKAAAEAQDVHVEAVDVLMADHFFSDNDWYVIFNDQGGVWRVYLMFENYENPGALAGSYTKDNITGNLSYLLNLETSERYTFEDINFTCEGVDPEVSIEMTGSASLAGGGNLTFHLNKKAVLEPTETWNVTATVEDIQFNSPEHQGNTYITAVSTEKNRQFELAIDGTAGLDYNVNIAISSIKDLATGEVIAVDHGTLDILVDGTRTATLHADIVGADAIEYIIDGTGLIPVEGEVNVDVHNLRVTCEQSVTYYFDGSNDDYSKVHTQMTYYNPGPGDYYYFMLFNLTDKDGNEVRTKVPCSAYLSLDEANNYVIDASFIGNDGKFYTIHMDRFIPEVTSHETFTSTVANTLLNATDDLGAVQIYGYSDDAKSYLSFVFDMYWLSAGHYNKLSNNFADFCNGIPQCDAEGKGDYVEMYKCDVDLTVNEEEDTYTLTGTCQVGTILYDVYMAGPITTASSGDSYDNEDEGIDYTYQLENLVETTVFAEDGYALVVAKDDKSVFKTVLFIGGDELAAGTYTINNTYVAGTAQPGQIIDGAVYPTYFGYTNEDGDIYVPLWLCNEGTVTVDYVDGNLTLEVNALNTWGNTVHIAINPQEAPELDSKEDVEATFAYEDIVDLDIAPQWGYGFIEAQNAEGEFKCMMFLNSDGLVEGEYPINDSYLAPSVQSGYFWDVYPNATYYAHKNADGETILPLWICQTGSVKVSYIDERVSLEVNAKNSVGSNIHLLINGSSTGIESVSDQQQKDGKFLRDNELIIRRNGKEYDSLGRMK